MKTYGEGGTVCAPENETKKRGEKEIYSEKKKQRKREQPEEGETDCTSRAHTGVWIISNGQKKRRERPDYTLNTQKMTERELGGLGEWRSTKKK